ncbi:hypothetical protein Tco_1081647 [Tanacetum coccineum]|uniref:Uncharacterized protein n=1 Tax=Tanacetum coccineum TaxID=301880 RepID=A0ABQ5HZT2_9ASTR
MALNSNKIGMLPKLDDVDDTIPSKNLIQKLHDDQKCMKKVVEDMSGSYEYKLNQDQDHRLEEEKDCRHGKVYNWETATFGKIWYYEDVHDLKYVETEFPTIVFDDALTSDVMLLCEPTVSLLNDKIDFRISFDESDDEDYTVIYGKNSFSYKIIYVNDFKTDSENDNDKVNMPSFPSPEPTVSYFNDFDFLKDFEKEFPAVAYNDALTSKLDFLTEPTVSPQHINEFNLKDETSLSKCDEGKQNVLYFNNLFPFNVIYPDDLKSDTDNDNDEIDIEQPSGNMSVIPLPNVINVYDGAYAHGYQYDVSWGMDMAYRIPVEFQDLLNENDKFGGVLIFWKLMCVVVMLASKSTFTTYNLARKRNLENLSSKISGEFLIKILLIPVLKVLFIQRGHCII